ncbi:Uncharacterized protein FKW44_004721, partial [Caligus rogercresseyi]
NSGNNVSTKAKSIIAICNICMEESQTANHLINRCPSLSYERYQVMQEEDEDLRIIKFIKCKKMQRIIDSNYNLTAS